jgi:hypothetical protein
MMSEDEAAARALAVEMFTIFVGVAQSPATIDAYEKPLDRAVCAALGFQERVVAACRQLVRVQAEATWRSGLIERSDALTEVLVEIDRRYLAPAAWQLGTGIGLPNGTLAWVDHPKHGIVWAELTYYVESDPGQSERTVWCWGAYGGSVGEILPAAEITRYQVVRRPEP